MGVLLCRAGEVGIHHAIWMGSWGSTWSLGYAMQVLKGLGQYMSINGLFFSLCLTDIRMSNL